MRRVDPVCHVKDTAVPVIRYGEQPYFGVDSTHSESCHSTIITNKLTVATTMSSSTTSQTYTLSSDFNSVLDAALSEYKKKTGKKLLDHPLATEVQRCDSLDAILAIFQGQAEAFQQFRAGDQRLMKCTSSSHFLRRLAWVLVWYVSGIEFMTTRSAF